MHSVGKIEHNFLVQILSGKINGSIDFTGFFVLKGNSF